MKSNRRGFLKFLSTAPVVAEAVVKTVPEKPAAVITEAGVTVGSYTVSTSVGYHRTALPAVYTKDFEQWKKR
jgi:hypothetical protein